MKKTIKNGLIISLAFGLYQLLIGLFFGTYNFVSTNISHVIYLTSVFLILSSFEFIYLSLAIKTEKPKGVNKILFSGSFIITGILGGAIVWLLTSSNFENFFLHVASFLIASFLPSVFYLLYFVFKDAEEKISKMGKIYLKTSETLDQEIEKVFHLENDHGKMLLEIAIKQIICFEANDNYVVTHFLNKNNELKKSMERVSLKKIEELLAIEEVQFFRVHKSYLINPEYLEEIKGKAQAYKIKLKHLETLIPVSRSYDINQLPKQF